jgi:predicted RNA-binding Zn-ribbon protein involved in translation (DUF1610 family)
MFVCVCPKCGGDLTFVLLTSYPPQPKYSCNKCGFSRVETKQVVRVTLKET